MDNRSDVVNEKFEKMEPAHGKVIQDGREILFQGHYAYILPHSGISAVFYDHFYDCGDSMHDQIVKLVATSQDIHGSTIRILEAQPNLYAAMI